MWGLATRDISSLADLGILSRLTALAAMISLSPVAFLPGRGAGMAAFFMAGAVSGERVSAGRHAPEVDLLAGPGDESAVAVEDVVAEPAQFLLAARGGGGSRLGWLRAADAGSAWTTSVCTGSLLLAAARGRRRRPVGATRAGVRPTAALPGRIPRHRATGHHGRPPRPPRLRPHRSAGLDNFRQVLARWAGAWPAYAEANAQADSSRP
jgi:hypothetical protein